MKVNLSNTWLKAGVAVGTFLATSPVFAQATVGTITTQVGTTTTSLGTAMNAGCWGSGTLVFVKGLWGCYEHGKNAQTKLGPQVASLLGGGALLTAPSLISAMTSGIGGTAGSASVLHGMATNNSF